MSDGFSPIKGKCNYWRESPNEEDRWDPTVKAPDKRVDCSCFIEGKVWFATASTILEDCPEKFHCRYYVKYG